jgi:hypothetical protein
VRNLQSQKVLPFPLYNSRDSFTVSDSRYLFCFTVAISGFSVELRYSHDRGSYLFAGHYIPLWQTWHGRVTVSVKIVCLRYWFGLSRNVYGGNRSFASYTKTKTVESAVWCLLTQLDDGDSQQVTGNGIEIPEYGSGPENSTMTNRINDRIMHNK